MDDGHFAWYVQRNYDINAITTTNENEDLQADLKYQEYGDDNRSALKSDPLDFVHCYGHVKQKSAETRKDNDKSNSSDDDDEKRPAAKEPDDIVCPEDLEEKVMVEDNTIDSPSNASSLLMRTLNLQTTRCITS